MKKEIVPISKIKRFDLCIIQGEMVFIKRNEEKPFTHDREVLYNTYEYKNIFQTISPSVMIERIIPTKQNKR